MKCGKTTLARAGSTVLLLAGFLSNVACFKAGPTPTAASVSITLLPSATSLGPGQALTVTANIYDQSGQGASWTVSPLNFGTLSSQSTTSVTYTAPKSFPSPVTVTITATSIAVPTITSSVQITASPLTVSLFPPSAQTMNEGSTCSLAPPNPPTPCQMLIFANVFNDIASQGVTWALSPASGAGSLSAPQSLSVAYVAPDTVSSPTTVTITATSVANSSQLATLQITVFPSGAGLNVALIDVNGGPVPGQVSPNSAYTSVTVCKPGSTTACQTLGGILVDTGSSGFRVLQSAIPLLKLPGLVDANSNTLQNCFSLGDGSFLWGPVEQADIYITGELAGALPIQVISSSTNEVIPQGCSNGGSNQNTPQLLGANGILGVGPEPNDCELSGTNYCDGITQPVPPNVYYSCLSNGCTTTNSPVIVADLQQVANPIPSFAPLTAGTINVDANGVILAFPPASESEVSLQGRMIFGIGTETDSTIGNTTISADNSLGNATVFTIDANDRFTTLFNGQALTSGYIDSGADAIFFSDSSLPTCTIHSQFFCPSSVTNLSATNQGTSQGTNTVDFSVGNADDLFSANPDSAVFNTLAGPAVNSSCTKGNAACSFTWGLPFFYGRSVYTAIDGQSVSGAPKTPWWAY